MCGGGQVGGCTSVKAGAAGDMAGLAQNGGFLLCQRVKIGLHIVKQFAGDNFVDRVPHAAGTAVGVRHAVAQMHRAVPHHALNTDKHGQAGTGGSGLHRGGFGILGAPDMHKVGLFGLQQGGKTVCPGQDAVGNAVLFTLQGGLLAGIGAGNGQAQFAMRA